MMSARRLGWTCVLLVLAVLPAPATAQVQDSVELRIRESLRRLERPPAPDTAALDTAVVITGARPGGARAPAPAGRDSVAQALLGLAGYGAAQYEGLAAEFDATERVLILHGDSTRRAILVHEGAELTADSVIRYDEVSGQVQGLGRPVYTPPQGDPITSREIIYDLAEQRGTALGARTRYSEGATWYVTGDLPSVSPDVVYGSETHFTSCDLDVPHYHFAADEIKIIAGRVLVARPVKLYFGDVPVAWFPFIAQSLGSGRASGLLTPRFSVNDIVRTSGGYRRRVSNVGFYWAMSDYADATVALDWFSDNFTSVTGSLRYAWARQFLNGTVNMRRYWQAGGGTQFAFDTNNSWQMDERTSFRMSARYSSSADFIRRNSFDPREVTQSINSTGGIDRRFEWGNISLSGNRDQYLSDDRLEMTLPEVQLNLSSITLFRAPPGRGSWWNNLTWSGGAGGSRRTIDRVPEPGETISAATADLENIGARARSSFNLGKLSWSQSFTLERASVLQVPVGFGDPVLGFSPSGQRLVPMAAATTESGETLRDITRTDLSWQTSLGYQQPLIGSTTLTPSLTLQGNVRRSDTIDVASDHFVSGPVRLSFGARLQSDLFGFLPGIGPFEAIRHKLSPGIDFSYAPEVASSELQERVFGRQAIRPRKQLTFSVNQTFEAKRRQVDTVAVAPPPGAPADTAAEPGGPRPAPRRQDIVTLLALRTTAIQYDFVEADEQNDPLFGFQTTRISNQISSDFLRGLSISMSHGLFDDQTVPLPGGGTRRERRFDLHLADLNLGFSLDHRSALFRGFGLFGGGEDADTAPADTATVDLPEDPFRQPTSATDESTVIPGQDRRGPVDQRDEQRRRAQPVGTWSANFSYSFAHPRDPNRSASQMLSATFQLKPTTLWSLSWRTSYDLERGGFNDHMVRLTRDIHDWEAHFNFAQTATGNWAFRFDVSLKANKDIHFDFKQNNVVTTRTAR